MKAKTARHALLMSALSLLLCVSMLVGTTFAWFTDSVTSGRNTIQAGNLDVVLEYWDGDSYEEVTSTTKLFDDAALWEPGYTEVAYLKVSNAGSLALKYQLAVNVYNETLGKTKDSADIKLSDHLQFKVVESDTDLADTYTRETAKNANATATKLQTYNSEVKPLNAKNEAGDNNYYDYVALIIYMPETVGNEANHNGVNIPAIEMGVSLFATQQTYEFDSFDDQYDAGLDPTTTYLFSGTDIHNSTTNSGRFALSADIKTSESNDRYGYGYEYIVRKGADYTLDLNGKTLVHDVVNENANHNALTYLFVANNAGTKLTIEGEGKVYCNNSEGYTCAIQGKDGTLVTVNGGDYEVDNGIAVWAGAGAHIVINGGSFVNANATTNHELIYSSGGVIDIYGGFFHNTDGNYTLNVEDRNRATGFINVYGGTYVNFDPSTGGQDPNNIKVADGYMVTSEKQANGDVWYTVVPVSEGYELVKTAEDVVKAFSSGKNVVLADNIVITETLDVKAPTNIDLNGKELTVSRIEANSVLTINGGTLVNGEATYPAISVNDGGKLVLNDVRVVGGTPCNIVTSGSAQAAEIVGIQVFGGECVLNNCEIYVDVTELRYSNSVFAIGIHGGSLTMNGGSVTVKSVGSTKEKYDYQAAIFAGGNTDKVVTLNDVDVDAKNFLYAWGGTTTVNTTADDGAHTGFDAKNGGTYTINYNYNN